MARYVFKATPPAPANAQPAARVRAPRAPDPYVTTMERDFPRVLQAIQAMWGYQEMNLYFRKLMMDERGARDGFPKDVWEDLYMLAHMHQQILPDVIVQGAPDFSDR